MLFIATALSFLLSHLLHVEGRKSLYGLGGVEMQYKFMSGE
jgi:hypothetical protein